MPLTSKGEKIMGAMQEQYGAEKGKSVFYASKNAGRISGVDQKDTILQSPMQLDQEGALGAIGSVAGGVASGIASGMHEISGTGGSNDETTVPAGPTGPQRPEQKPYTQAASLDALRSAGKGGITGASSG